MNWTINQIRKGVYLVEADTLYALTSMFMRPQEYYESPYENIRDEHFSVEEFMDTYAKDKGSFSYFTDWCGFNIPSEVIKTFFQLFRYDLTNKETILRNLIESINPNMDGKFYVIGVCSEKRKDETIKHETAHAYYYMDKKYKHKMDQLVDLIPFDVYEKAKNSLLFKGYCDTVIFDEIQAYLSTKKRVDLIRIFGWKYDQKVPTSFKKFFKEYDEAHK
jgi:hypothetical protein